MSWKLKPSVMLDLETLGTEPGAVIVSIGAVLFDAKNGVTSRFYCRVDPKSCQDLGMTIQARTIQWWMRQSSGARAVFDVGSLGIHEALGEFSKFLGDAGGRLIWGNGSDFDNAILGKAYDLAGLPRPWDFWNNACYRTLKNLYPQVKVAREGVHHNALDDAEYQAIHLLRIHELAA